MATSESRELLEATLHELFQTEMSATRHPRLEAERLGPAPPAAPMQACVRHAEGALVQVTELAKSRGVERAPSAKAVGRGFSALRDKLGDLTMTSEQSYRMTLLGMKHGLDVVRMLRELSVIRADAELQVFCDDWLAKRSGIVADAEQALSWFVQNPTRALEPARLNLAARVARYGLRWFRRADTTVRTPSPAR